MRLLDRYLLRELLIPLFYCLSGFLLIVIVVDLIKELGSFQKRGLVGREIVQYYLVLTPGYLALILPIALLLALLYALSNHSRYHEITAIRAAGVSLWRLGLPYLGVGFLASIALFVLNEFYAPDSDEAAEKILDCHQPPAPGALPRNQTSNLPFTNARAGRHWHMSVFNTETGEMLNPLVIWSQPDGSCLWITAKRAAYVNGIWTFYNVEEKKQPAQTNAFPVPLLMTNVLAFPQFTETPEQIKSAIRIGSILVFHPSKRADLALKEILNYLRLNPDPRKEDARWLYTKLYGRLAAPWTCLVVVLIALPIGAASGRRNVFVGVASSLGLFLSFWLLQLAGLMAGTAGWVPPWLAAWFPNLAFGLGGLWMTARVR
jgi:lipopolysaccharide export system permease protein